MSKKLSTSLQIGRDGIKYFEKRKNYILYSTQKDCGYIEKTTSEGTKNKFPAELVVSNTKNEKIMRSKVRLRLQKRREIRQERKVCTKNHLQAG